MLFRSFGNPIGNPKCRDGPLARPAAIDDLKGHCFSDAVANKNKDLKGHCFSDAVANENKDLKGHRFSDAAIGQLSSAFRR